MQIFKKEASHGIRTGPQGPHKSQNQNRIQPHQTAAYLLFRCGGSRGANLPADKSEPRYLFRGHADGRSDAPVLLPRNVRERRHARGKDRREPHQDDVLEGQSPALQDGQLLRRHRAGDQRTGGIAH